MTELDTDEEPQLTKATKPAAKGKNKRPAEDSLLEEDGEALDDMIAEAQAAEAKKADSAPSLDEKPKKLSKAEKKKLKKLKNNDGEAATAPIETVKDKAAEKKSNTPSVNGTSAEKKVSFAKNLEQGPTPNGTAKSSSSVASEASQPSKKSTSLGVRDVQGVSVDDRKVGTGKQAKSGDRVEMRYIGKLENGKVFDANKSGKPFAFKLGAGEVIKGWDIGIAGMLVGGERRITVPAHLAYGKKAQKDIPANSKLIFDVKCLSIK